MWHGLLVSCGSLLASKQCHTYLTPRVRYVLAIASGSLILMRTIVVVRKRGVNTTAVLQIARPAQAHVAEMIDLVVADPI